MKDILNNLAFNPYIFSICLTFAITRPTKIDFLLYPILFIPVLFGYQYVLIIILVVQLICQIFSRYNVELLKKLFFYYFVLILYPILGELLGWSIQIFSHFVLHKFLDYLILNIICFIPEILICILIYLTRKRHSLKISKINSDISYNPNFLNLLVWIIWIFNIVTYAIWTIIELINIKPIVELVLMIVVLLIIVILLLNLYKTIQESQKIIKTRIQNAEIKQIQEYSSRLEEANLTLRKARHDYKNSLLSLNGYLSTNDIEGAKKYLIELVNDNNRLQNANKSMTLELANLKIKELKYLIIDKLQQAQDKGIQTKVEINKQIDAFPTSIVNIIRCVGIFLDNAIEACQNQKDAKISVLITKYSGNNYSLTVQNTITHFVDVTKSLKPMVTSKQNHEGLGLNNVNEIVNNDLYLSLEIEQNAEEISFELIIQEEKNN
ncbi:sensor histidine kinase [Lactobacillus intestinalis]|uniref:sensor histidine kinase n=1 Tax=Lactobacillus intestinalis TaxID=151781 RepID=UPI00242D3B6C|nr:GHKL domain-containing protein [Lactobacillus intestinalis]